jgi:hypothetical protein
MTNHNTPPLPIRRHLSRRNLNTRASDARIEQVFYPGLGWSDHIGQPLPTFSAIRVLQNRGITTFAVGYNLAHKGGRVRADFTVKECLEAREVRVVYR